MHKITIDGKEVTISDESYRALQEAIQQPNRWRAELSGKYWCVNDFGHADHAYDVRGDFDDYSYDTGNYFKTEEEAEHYREVQLATQRLKDAAEGFEPDWNDSRQEKF